jgi:hypothetical protein
LVRLTKLYCGNSPNITDKGIQHLVRLTESDFGNCPNITSNMKQIIIDNMRQIITTKKNT